jgi:hypothetical protein
MKALRMTGLVIGLALSSQAIASAQAPSSGFFADAGAMVERDPTDFFYGSPVGAAGRAAFGAQLSERNSVRFELDIPRWRVTDTVSTNPVWCAQSARCVGGEGFVPARTTDHTAVRTISYSFLYARQLPVARRVTLALVAGGSIEQREFQASGTFDELDRDGRVVRHTESARDSGRNWPAAVVGVDAEIAITSHWAVSPQFRYHTFGYPYVSIVRPGVALRFRF